MLTALALFLTQERSSPYGENLKGKECGKGICQRKDGFYYARFVDKYGKRHEKYVATLPEIWNWLEEARFADTHDNILIPSDMTWTHGLNSGKRT